MAATTFSSFKSDDFFLDAQGLHLIRPNFDFIEVYVILPFICKTGINPSF